jgi:hypothetical protein
MEEEVIDQVEAPVQEPEVPTDTVVLTEDVECGRMNRELEQLESLRGQLTENRALTSDVALEHQALTGTDSLVDAYFSTGTKVKKFQLASEGLLETTQTLLKKAKDLLWNMIVKVFNWFTKMFLDKKPLTEAAVEAEHRKFKDAVGPIQRAERVPSSRTAIIAAVREEGLDQKFVTKLTPEEMDIYNEGPYHQAMQRLIPTLKGFDVYDVVAGLENWHKKTLTEAFNFDNENGQQAPEVIERKLEQFKKDATRTLESATQMSRSIMDVRLQGFQQGQEERRKLKADPHFHLGTDLSGIMARGIRIFEQSGYKQMGDAMVDVHKGLTKTTQHLQELRQHSEMAGEIRNNIAQPGQQRLAEEFVEQAFMKEVNRIISTLHQCVQSVQMLNNYFSFVVASTRTMLDYVRQTCQAAIKHGGDAASLNEVLQSAVQGQQAMTDAQSKMTTDTQTAGM